MQYINLYRTEWRIYNTIDVCYQVLAELLNHYTGHIIVSLCCFVGYFCLCCVLLRFRIFLFAGISLSSNAFDLPGLLYNTLMFPSILQTLHKILVLFFDMKVTQIRRAATVSGILFTINFKKNYQFGSHGENDH